MGKLCILGFADRPEGEFIGHVTDPDRIVVDKDGYLSVETLQIAEE